jgi:hypothetical protein
MMLGHSFCFALASAGGCNLGYDVTLGWVWIISETERIGEGAFWSRVLDEVYTENVICCMLNGPPLS